MTIQSSLGLGRGLTYRDAGVTYRQVVPTRWLVTWRRLGQFLRLLERPSEQTSKIFIVLAPKYLENACYAHVYESLSRTFWLIGYRIHVYCSRFYIIQHSFQFTELFLIVHV